MKKTQTRFIKAIGNKDAEWQVYDGSKSSFALNCEGFETKTVVSVSDTHNYQMNTYNERIGKLKFVR